MTEEIKLPKIPRPDSKPPVSEAVLRPIQLDGDVVCPTDLEKTGIGGATVKEAETTAPPESEPPPEGDPRFELRLTETKADVGSIPITWCVDREWLFKNSNEEQYVLLSTAPPEKSGSVAEWRSWAKLSDMMAYVTFYRPGKNRILARISPSRAGIKDWMERSRDGGSWQGQAMAFPESWENEKSKENCKYLLDRKWMDSRRPWNYIDIDMPTGCFAKDPSDKEKSWVNFFFKNKAVDQCEFRRRRMLAYTIQPIIFLIVALFYVVALSVAQIFNLMIGRWVIWQDMKAFKADRKVNFLKVKKFGPIDWLLMPIPWIITASLVMCKLTHLSRWLLMAPAFLLAIPVVFGILCLGFWVWEAIAKKSPMFKAWRAKAREAERQRLMAIYKAELEALDLLLCSSGKKIYRLKDLPKKKRTIKLRFQGIKSVVCRPFAR